MATSRKGTFMSFSHLMVGHHLQSKVTIQVSIGRRQQIKGYAVSYS